jgi:hypothetical protein
MSILGKFLKQALGCPAAKMMYSAKRLIYNAIDIGVEDTTPRRLNYDSKKEKTHANYSPKLCLISLIKKKIA